jgi:uncharacterized protein
MLSELEMRPRRGSRILPLLVIALIVLAATGGYAHLIEPQRIQVTRHSIAGKVHEPLRIAHLTDLHTSGFGQREQNLVMLVRAENPDLIVITGDIVDKGLLAPARDLLINLSAPLGVWIVRGNWENWGVREDEHAFFTTAGARFLSNAGALVRPDLWVGGLDDPSTGEPDLDRALAGAPAAAFKLVLMHAPDYFHDIGGRFDLALAGHTHGGQVRLPLYGPLWLPPGGKRYVAGWYTRHGSQLYVSRGIGTSIARFRFLARPELAIIEIRPR